MTTDFPFPGVIDPAGRLHLDNRSAFDQHAKALAGKRVVLSVREDRATRSTRQLRWEFGVALPLIADACGYDRADVEELHYELLAIHYGRRYNRKLHKYVPKVKRSRQLDTKQYAEHQEWLARWAAATYPGLYIPMPNEVDLSTGEMLS